ncbi:MAG: hypothetical protein ACJA2X_002351 [Halocynthiibacter sp.]|jgi:hypothetical protein
MFSLDNWLSVSDVLEEIWQKVIAEDTENTLSIDELRSRTLKEFTDFLGYCDSAAAMSPSGSMVRVRASFLRQILNSGTDHRFFSYNTGLLRPIREQISLSAVDAPESEKWYKRLFRQTHLEYTLAPIFSSAWAYFALALGALISGVLVFILGIDTLYCGPECVSELTTIFRLIYIFLTTLMFSLSALCFVIAIDKFAWHWQYSPAQQDKLYGFEGFSIIFPSAKVAQFLSLEDQTDSASKGSEASVARKIVKLFDQNVSFTRGEAQSSLGSHLSVRGFGRAWDMASSERPELSKPGRKPRK